MGSGVSHWIWELLGKKKLKYFLRCEKNEFCIWWSPILFFESGIGFDPQHPVTIHNSCHSLGNSCGAVSQRISSLFNPTPGWKAVVWICFVSIHFKFLRMIFGCTRCIPKHIPILPYWFKSNEISLNQSHWDVPNVEPNNTSKSQLKSPNNFPLNPQTSTVKAMAITYNWLFLWDYTIWLFNIAMENHLKMEVLMGTSSINGPFSMAMLNNQRVHSINVVLLVLITGITRAITAGEMTWPGSGSVGSSPASRWYWSRHGRRRFRRGFLGEANQPRWSNGDLTFV